jgi:hypothetical protein
MSLSQQAALKSRLADRRQQAGLSEVQTYQTWRHSLTPDQYASRSQERKHRFQTLSPAERGASVAAWDRHRLRYGLTHQRLRSPDNEQHLTTDHEHAALLPDESAKRDNAFLERQGQLFDPPDQQAAG